MINSKILRQKLSSLVPDVTSIKMILSDIGVNYSKIELSKDSSIEANWFAVLESLKESDKIDALLGEILLRFPGDNIIQQHMSKPFSTDPPATENKPIYVDAQTMIDEEMNFDIQSLKLLLERGKSKSVLSKLSIYSKELTDEYQNQIIGLNRRWHDFELDKASGVLTYEIEKVERARLTQAISYFINKIEQEKEVIEILNTIHSKSNVSTVVSSNLNINKVQLEKIMKGRNDLVEIEWLDKAKEASKSVCKTLHKSNKNGTGWIYMNKYLFTNNHIVSSKKEALETKLIFNYQKDSSTVEFTLDPDSLFVTDPILDYSVVAIKGIENLTEFGSLEIEDHITPKKGNLVNIIQHPEGEPKMIAMPDEIISVNLTDNFLFYLADTKGGSSGSPVFNQDWKVVALHHGGMKKEDGGLIINEQGDKAEANRGSLMTAILKDIKSKAINL